MMTLVATLSLLGAEQHGFPDAEQQRRSGGGDAVLVGCVGDSITAGYKASSRQTTYPSVLQALLGDGYKVTNMGEGGATMRAGADSPYWLRRSYQTLTSNRWDILILMLGTNDAKDSSSRGPPNWLHDCSAGAPLECQFSRD